MGELLEFRRLVQCSPNLNTNWRAEENRQHSYVLPLAVELEIATGLTLVLRSSRENGAEVRRWQDDCFAVTHVTADALAGNGWLMV